MSRTKRFFYNSLSTAVLQVVTMIAGFITPRVMLKFYGSEINGLASSISQFIAYFNLVEAGLSSAAIYALYKPLANKDYKAVNAVVSAAKKFYAQAGYIFTVLTIGLAVIYPVYVETTAITPLNVGLLVLILGVNGALEFFTLAKFRALLSADQRMYVISLASIAHIVVSTLIIVVMAQLKVNIVILRLVALLSIFLRSLILMLYVKLNYRYINYKEKPNTNALNKRWDALYLQILGVVHTGAPVIVLTVVLRDLKLVSVFTIFNMVLSGIRGILGIFTSGLSASFGDVIARRERETLQKSYGIFEFAYYSLITIVYSIAGVTIMPFIRIYTSGVTDINYNLPVVGILFVLDGLLYNLKTPQGMLVISAGMYKETKMQTTIQGAIAVLGGIVLAPFLGIVGVLIASIISNIYRDIDLLFFIPKYVTKLPVSKSFYRIIRILACMVIICITFLFIELNPINYVSWIVTVVIVGVYSTVIVALSGLIFDFQDMRSVGRRLMSIVGVKK